MTISDVYLRPRLNSGQGLEDLEGLGLNHIETVESAETT